MARDAVRHRRGLTTSAIPHGSGLLELELDLVDHVLVARLSDGTAGTVRLRPMSVADFHVEVGQLLARLGVNVGIWPVPVEVVDATPFADDVAPGGYDPEHARALHWALINSHRVLTRFRGGFIGKSSPVHFFWGGFDIAATRFSGRPAPRHPGGVPNCPDYVQHEAYSHEVSSAGWWPGSNRVPPSFYAYMYPEPAGFATTAIEPAGGIYQQDFREFIRTATSSRARTPTRPSSHSSSPRTVPGRRSRAGTGRLSSGASAPPRTPAAHRSSPSRMRFSGSTWVTKSLDTNETQRYKGKHR